MKQLSCPPAVPIPTRPSHPACLACLPHAEACRIRITVLNGTSSGGHKVKVSGVIVSEVQGWSIADGQQPLPVLFGGATSVWDDHEH